MKEQSRLEEMRAAIRGDLERAEARRRPIESPARPPVLVEEPAVRAEPEPEPVDARKSPAPGGRLARLFRR